MLEGGLRNAEGVRSVTLGEFACALPDEDALADAQRALGEQRGHEPYAPFVLRHQGRYLSFHTRWQAVGACSAAFARACTTPRVLEAMGTAEAPHVPTRPSHTRMLAAFTRWRTRPPAPKVGVPTKFRSCRRWTRWYEATGRSREDIGCGSSDAGSALRSRRMWAGRGPRACRWEAQARAQSASCQARRMSVPRGRRTRTAVLPHCGGGWPRRAAFRLSARNEQQFLEPAHERASFRYGPLAECFAPNL